MKHIGLTTTYAAPPEDATMLRKMHNYLDCLSDAGAQGEMLWLPEDGDAQWVESEAERLADQLDGLLITGGADLPPQLYGEQPRLGADLDIVNLLRPAWESKLLPAFVERGKPVLGICYGCQIINVWRGGSLLQDIPTMWPDPIRHDNDILHLVRLEGDSKLHRVVGEHEFEVCSYHHQAIARVGGEGIVTAWAPDHSPEGIEFTDETFLLGVQWHPERTRDSAATRRLFEAFARAA